MSYSFRFRYAKAFITLNIMLSAAAFLSGATSIAWIVCSGFSWARLVFGIVFIALALSILSQICVRLSLDKYGIKVKSVIGTDKIPFGQIESISMPDAKDLRVKNMLVKYSVYAGNRPLASQFVTGNEHIVVITRKINHSIFSYAVSCPTSDDAINLCRTFEILKDSKNGEFMKWRRFDQKEMPWYYYFIVIIALLAITYIGLFLAGEVDDPIDFLLNLRSRYIQL